MIQVLFVAANVTNILSLVPYADYRGLKFHIAKNLQEGLSIISDQRKIDVVIADRDLPDGHGVDLLKAKNHKIGCPSQFFLTAEHCDRVSEQQALSLGVSEVLQSPIGIPALEKIFHKKSAEKATQTLATTQHVDALSSNQGFCGLIGASAVMQSMYNLIKRVAPTTASSFIIGASGCGKELVAQAIHQSSGRSKKPFVAINCGAISEELVGSALFGHEKGSFTGAVQTHKGYFEQASGGTLFLDEITETSQDLQVSLLRVLETHKIIPVGGQRQIDVDVRILASTNRDPKIAVPQGILREDLYHRLNVFPILVPSLAERDNDIALLAEFFLAEHNALNHCHKLMTPAALACLKSLMYPGNVRQLKNIIHRAYILADETIEVEHIQNY